MCGRGVLEDLEQALLEDLRIQEVQLQRPPPRYNVAPTQEIPTIHADSTATLRGTTWGIPHPSHGGPVFNARMDSLDSSMWRSKTPAVHLLTGFYEWRSGRREEPYYVRPKQGWMVAAALSDGAASATITTQPNEEMRTLHDRMPFVLTPGQARSYLEGTPLAELDPPKDEIFDLIPVSTKVNSVRNDGPELLVRVPAQSRLF